MIIAYKSCQPDNGTHMWASKKTRGAPPPGTICPLCNQRIDYFAINPNYMPPNSKNDLSRCLDGDFLVSPLLKEFLESMNLTGISFQQIKRSKRYFVLKCLNELQLIPPSTLVMSKYCEACKQYQSVGGINWIDEPIKFWFRGVCAPIRDGIYLTDLKTGGGPFLFGSDLIFGVDTWEKIKAQKFKGAYARAIHN